MKKKLLNRLIRFLRGGDVVIMDIHTYTAQQLELENRLCDIEKRVEDLQTHPPEAAPASVGMTSPAELLSEWLYGAQGGDA